MRRRLVGKAHRVHVIIVSGDPVQRLARLNIINRDRAGVGPGNKLLPVARKSHGHDAEMRRYRPQWSWITAEIQGVRVALILRVRGREANARCEGRVREPLVIRAQGRVGESPLRVRVGDGLVMLPYVGVGGIVEPDPKVMAAGEKEVAVI